MLAYPALARPTRGRVEIFPCIRMPMRAVCFRSVERPRCCPSWPATKATPRVLGRRNRLQVLIIDASADAAKVIGLQAWRNRAIRQLIRNGMGRSHLAIGEEPAVALPAERRYPQMTWAKVRPIR